MPNPAFLVDGDLEQRVVQRLCPGTTVQIVHRNGKDVALAAMAARIATLIRNMGNRYYPIIIIVDREHRQITAQNMQTELVNFISDEGISNDQFRVVVADRMVENWMLFDTEALAKMFGIDTSNFRPREGSGKGRLRTLISGQASYHETTTGVELFLSLNYQKIYKQSVSFRALVDAIDFDCLLVSKAKQTRE